MEDKLHNLLNNLCQKKEFKFLENTFQKKKLIYFKTIYSGQSKFELVSELYKFPFHNFFVIDKKCYFINDKISEQIFTDLTLGETFFLDLSKIRFHIKQKMLTIIDDLPNITITKEFVLLRYLLKQYNIYTFIEKILHTLLIYIIKQILKNKADLDNIIFKYTDFCFKLGETFFNFFTKEIAQQFKLLSMFFSSGNYNKTKDYINIFKNNAKLEDFNNSIEDKSFDTIIKCFNIFFKTEDKQLSNDLYKIIRNYIIYKTYEKNDIYPLEFHKIHHQHLTTTLSLGSLILEHLLKPTSYIDKNKNIFIKKFFHIRINNKINKILIIKLNNIYFNNFDISLNKPYLKNNNLNYLYEKTKKYTNINTMNDYIDNNCDNDFEDKRFPIENFVLNITKLDREQNFITSNPDMTTKVKTNTYLKNKHNLDTKFVIDTDYLYSFLNLLKYHMLEKTKDIQNKLTFIEKLKKHENIFLLYQISIKSILNFYNKYNKIKEIKLFFKNILTCILNYNIDDFYLKHNNNKICNILNKSEIPKIQKTIIKNFIKRLFDKIFSYKNFMKSLIQECVLYSHFRYFILDSFLDTRGRCYYNGFYLNPQSYPIVKAFVKLYNPTKIEEPYYTSILLPTIKKFIHYDNHKNILDQRYKNFDYFINQQSLLRQEYLNNLLNVKININEDIILRYRNIKDPIELSLAILNFLKTKINKTKKLYVIYSMFIRILYPKKEIQNYYELDATASGLQMTSMLFQNKSLAAICNLTKNPSEISADIYTQCSTELLKYLENLEKQITMLFGNNKNYTLIKIHLIFLLDKFLNKKITQHNLIKKIKIFCGNIQLKFKTKELLNKFIKEHSWICLDLIKNNNSEILIYFIILRGIKMQNLRKQYNWLDIWIQSRDFCKKAIMTYGYNATSYRRKQEWFETLLNLNNYENRTDLYFITIIAENLFNYIVYTRLKASNWLKNLGKIIQSNLIKNFKNKQTIKSDNLNIIFKNRFMVMEIHCYKNIIKRSNIKDKSMKLLHQLSYKYPKYIKKTFKTKKNIIVNKLVKQQNYSLLNRKFSPNFIHSMDAFLVHIFKEKLYEICKRLKKYNIIINHMTNHDNFSLTLEPFLKIILMDCYNTVYNYDYIHTLKYLNFYSEIAKYKLSVQQENLEDLLPGNFINILNEKYKQIYKPDLIDLSEDFVK